MVDGRAEAAVSHGRQQSGGVFFVLVLPDGVSVARKLIRTCRFPGVEYLRTRAGGVVGRRPTTAAWGRAGVVFVGFFFRFDLLDKIAPL